MKKVFAAQTFIYNTNAISKLSKENIGKNKGKVQA